MVFRVKLIKVRSTHREKRSVNALIKGIQFEQDVAPCDVLIYFDVPDEVMTKRLVKRGETSGRIDDNEETIKKRLKTFHDETQPILGHYGKQGKLVTIDANRKPDEVFTDVADTLKDLMDKHVGKQLEFVFSIYLCLHIENLLTSIYSFQPHDKSDSSSKGIISLSHCCFTNHESFQC